LRCKKREEGGVPSVNKERVREIEEKIAELKSRWPAHSVRPRMWQELETLEEELEQAIKSEEAPDGSER
jgi:hypothetical protein